MLGPNLASKYSYADVTFNFLKNGTSNKMSNGIIATIAMLPAIYDQSV